MIVAHNLLSSLEIPLFTQSVPATREQRFIVRRQLKVPIFRLWLVLETYYMKNIVAIDCDVYLCLPNVVFMKVSQNSNRFEIVGKFVVEVWQLFSIHFFHCIDIPHSHAIFRKLKRHFWCQRILRLVVAARHHALRISRELNVPNHPSVLADVSLNEYKHYQIRKCSVHTFSLM